MDSKNTSIEKRIFTFNGTQYNSLEEMPPEVKEIFADKNNDGFPDKFEKILDIKHNLSEVGELSSGDKIEQVKIITNKIVNSKIDYSQDDDDFDNKSHNINISQNPNTLYKNKSWYYALPILLLIILVLYLLFSK